MNRRFFTCGAASAAVLFQSKGMAMAGRSTDNPIRAANTVFAWRHEDGRLWGHFEAPTDGWLAVGFNARNQLENTRFIIAAPSVAPLHFEEHIALVPQHRPVQELGISASLSQVSGRFENQTSTLQFALPHRSLDGPVLNLSDGQQVSIMLTWSRDSDFNHHSAWRQHFWVIL